MKSFETILALLVASTALSVVARRLRMPVPIVMVLGGLAVALIPRHRIVEIDPDLAFTMFVPPILFGSALSTSMRYLKANIRLVLSLAVALILATTLAVAPLAQAYAHRLGWHGAFVLGAIVAPSDAVVTLVIADALRLSPRAVNVLEGEMLFNDATAFVVYGVAVRAATTGEFDWRTALPRFLLVAVGGVVVGWVVYRVVSFVCRRLEDTVLESVILLLTPFVAYLPAEALHVSGVLAVVVAGMLLRRAAPLLVSARTRLHAIRAASRAPKVPVSHVRIRLADSGRHQSDQHLVAHRLVELELFDDKRLPYGPGNGRADSPDRHRPPRSGGPADVVVHTQSMGTPRR
jgi:monovalent cation/hydrogen antiporter